MEAFAGSRFAGRFHTRLFRQSRLRRSTFAEEFDVLEITYSSDGLPVNGMLIKPKIPSDHKCPAITVQGVRKAGDFFLPALIFSTASLHESSFSALAPHMRPANLTTSLPCWTLLRPISRVRNSSNQL